MKDKLNESRGDFTINGALLILLVVALIVLFISGISVGSQKVRLDNMASELTRYIEVRGQADAAILTELERLQRVTGIAAEYRIEAEYISGTTKIAFGNPFTISLSCNGKIGMGGFLSITIPLNSAVSGRSERYWNS